MALAASVILAAVTAIVMGLVEAAHRGARQAERQHGRAARG
jgi:hypothetical protein